MHLRYSISVEIFLYYEMFEILWNSTDVVLKEEIPRFLYLRKLMQVISMITYFPRIFVDFPILYINIIKIIESDTTT